MVGYVIAVAYSSLFLSAQALPNVVDVDELLQTPIYKTPKLLAKLLVAKYYVMCPVAFEVEGCTSRERSRAVSAEECFVSRRQKFNACG